MLGALPSDPQRRLFLSRMIATGVGATSGLIALGGAVNVARGFDVRRVRVPLAKLPRSASGYTIVQITDVHVGPTIGRAFVEGVVRETNALAQRRKTFLTRSVLSAALAHYARYDGDEAGRLCATFDVIYLTGWAPDDRPAQP